MVQRWVSRVLPQQGFDGCYCRGAHIISALRDWYRVQNLPCVVRQALTATSMGVTRSPASCKPVAALRNADFLLRSSTSGSGHGFLQGTSARGPRLVFAEKVPCLPLSTKASIDTDSTRGLTEVGVTHLQP